MGDKIADRAALHLPKGFGDLVDRATHILEVSGDTVGDRAIP